MRFGLAVPTGTEGMIYPVPYADPDQAIELALLAERLGFDSVWGNDHLSTQAYVRAEFADAPRFYDPYVYLSYIAALTKTIKLATAVTVVTFRHPAVVAKQAMTLDQVSGGRFILGLGIGAYREETEIVWRDGIHRGRYAEEYMAACTELFAHRRASFHGEYIRFDDVESTPKGVQDRIPMLSGGNAAGSKERAARYGDGWIPACLTPVEMAQGLAEIRAVAEQAGRPLADGFDVAPQFGVAIGRTEEEAIATFERSQLHSHLESLSGSTLKGRQSDLVERNLVGTAEQIIEKIGRYREAGVTTLAGLLFASNDVAHTRDQMADFAENVIAAIRPNRSSTDA